MAELAAEQERVFKAHTGRRIVLATNVAETSLTVPGVRYVVDPGEARIKRYSYRNKVEQLKVEPISQAAARQRAGRCGRVADGVCIRLYDEADFTRRPVFTEPELHRRRADGSPIVVSVSTAPLRHPDGAIYGIMSILMDVTEHKSDEDEEVLRQFTRKVREVLDSA